MPDRFAPSRVWARLEIPSGVSGLLTILASGMIIALLYFARDILVPFALAILLTFLLSPAVRWLRRLRVGRRCAVSFTVFVAFIAISGFAGIVVQEIASLGRSLPEYRSNIQAKVHSLPAVIPGAGFIHRATAMLIELRAELSRSEAQPGTAPRGAVGEGNPATEPAKPLPVQITQPNPEPLQIVQSIIGPLLQPLAIGGLVVVFVVMILLEQEELRDRVLRLAGRGDLHRTTAAINDAAQRISRYLLSQLVVNTCCGVPIGLGLTVIGIPNPALWAIMAVILRFIPYMGIVIAASFPLALAIAVDPGWMLLVWTLLLFVAIELVVANLIEPLVYSDSTGLSSIAVIAAATFWTWLWGPIGLLLAVPLTVCLVVIGRHVPELQFLDVLLGNEPVLTPVETLYQRLLVGDSEAATELAEALAKERSLAAFFDEVVIPALVRAQADSDRGALLAEHREIISQGITAMLENLSDDPVRSGDPTPVETSPHIVCVAGRNELDEAAASVLVRILRLEGHLGIDEPLPSSVLAPDGSHRAMLEGANLVCLSLVSTSSPARARYLIRRVRRASPRATILVGFWGLTPSELGDAAGQIPVSVAIVVASLRAAVTKIASIGTANASVHAALDTGFGIQTDLTLVGEPLLYLQEELRSPGYR